MAEQSAAGSPASQPQQPRQVAFIGGSQLHLSDEIRSVLQQRLRILGALGVAVKLARTLGIWLLNRGTPDAEIHQNHIAVNLGTLFLMVAATALIWSRRNLPLWVLRLLETLVLLAVWTFLTSSTYWWLTTGDAAAVTSMATQAGAAPRWLWLLHPDGSITLASTWAARVVSTMWAYEWAMLIMLYGIFVPNTWRRCALIAGINIALPLITTLIAFRAHPALLPLLPRTMALVAVTVGFGSAVAVYGSHKISDLGSQVFAAKRVGQYLLQERVGTGGMGEVYRAQHQLLRRPCAVKLIRSDLPDLSRNLVRFEREVQAMASLNHPNNVEIYDYGRTEDGTFYYVMEYLPGLTLEQLGKEYGPLPFGRVVHFLRQCCGALGEAHRIRLIHRDIKPSSIFSLSNPC